MIEDIFCNKATDSTATAGKENYDENEPTECNAQYFANAKV